MHSPGPWALSHDSREGMEWNIHIVQEAAPHMTVCFMTSDGPNEDNARLIAAAPELLEALKALWTASVGVSDEEITARLRARLAIAKATGEAVPSSFGR